MSQPTPYTPTTDFSQQEANNASGRSTVNTAALDAEFANIENTLDATVNNLALIQRDDGKLSDELVEIQCLSRDVLNLIGGFVNRGDWVTATVYSVNDLVTEGGFLYWCATAHTASALFATDSAKWKKFGFTPADSTASAAAQASIDAHLVDTDSAHLSTAIAHGASTVSAELNALSSTKANISSPSFTGNPTAPTQPVGNSSTRIANTEFVSNAIAALDFQPSDPDISTVSASQAEMEAGTEAALRSMSPLRVRQAINTLPFTKEYVSTGQTIVAGGLITLSHGLGVMPKIVTLEYVCTIASDGYSIGDVIDSSNFNYDHTDGASTGFSTEKTTTQLLIRCAAAGPAFFAVKSGGGQIALGNIAPNFKLVARAFA